MIKKLNGVTLLEAMLAFAIASTIVLLGLRQYTYYKRDRDAFSLKYNVDVLLQGMRNYYYANCAESEDGNMTLHLLAPSRNPSNPFKIDITKTLSNYLDSSWRPTNPLIDTSFASDNFGYEAQFNNIVFQNKRSENFCYYYPNTGQQSPSCASVPNASAIIYLWIAQVVVKVKDTTMTLALKGLTGADCALGNYTGSSVVDCSNGAVSGNPSYLVWQRLPSFASPSMTSGLWRGASTVKGFNLQYTNDSLWELVSSPYEAQQYYLCGG
jgi:hypothetical protein